jgi:phosphoribosylanthranilate isomerase
MKLKICGMKYEDNIKAVAELQPEYMGFIFYGRSKRNFDGILPVLPKVIKKVGVFVDAGLEEINDYIEKFDLQAIQLHGDESPEFCKDLKNVEVIKVFTIGKIFDFDVLKYYEDVCDYFLFDTKGKEKGGNGIVFDWNLLENYPSEKPFFLSGGIGLEELESIKNFTKSELSRYCYALDVNSKFEDEPGLKQIDKLKYFKNNL